MSFNPREPRLGIFAWFAIPGPFAERMQMIRDAGFDSTSLWWEDDHPRGRRLRHLAPDMVRNADLTLDNIHVPYKKCSGLWSDNAEERRSVVQKHIEWVEDCARHAAPRMVMHANLGNGVAASHYGVDSFLRILDAAENNGVEVAIENTRYPHFIDYLFEEISSPYLTFCYDSSHDWLYSPQPFTLLKRWRARLSATHLADTDGILDRHWLPGDGVIDFAELAKQFPGSTFNGSYMLEVVAKKTEDPAHFLNKAYEALSSTVGLIVNHSKEQTAATATP